MSMIDRAKEWLFRIAAKKAVVSVAQLGASLALSNRRVLDAVGVSVSVDPNVLAIGIMGGLEIARNWVKFKFPRAFGWL